jgi:phage I-like protein
MTFPANTSPLRPLRLCGETAANSTPPAANIVANAFEVLHRDELRIPYGDFPHTKGLQRFTRAAAEAMTRRFHSLRGAVTRSFGGLPFYVGHPDEPSIANAASDDSAKGWIMDLQPGPDGLALSVKWNDQGADIIENARYKWFSPRWAYREIARENGKPVIEPYWLVSCGFTNAPNIPVAPLSNAQKQTKGVEMDWLLTLLHLPADASQAQAEDAVKAAISNAAAKQLAEYSAAAAKAEADAAKAKAAAAEAKAAKSESDLAGVTAQAAALKISSEADLAAANSRATAERAERCRLIVANALLEGRLSKAEEPATLENLAKDFDAASNALAKAPAIHRNNSVVGNLARRGVPSDSKGAAILVAVNTRMAETKRDYHTCYMQIKKEQPALFRS